MPDRLSEKYDLHSLPKVTVQVFHCGRNDLLDRSPQTRYKTLDPRTQTHAAYVMLHRPNVLI